MLSEKIKHEDVYPLLSCVNIEDLLAHFLPKHDKIKNEIIRHLEEGHRQRLRAVISHTKHKPLEPEAWSGN